jgi:holo-[acyl-carrier protein] synthase
MVTAGVDALHERGRTPDESIEGADPPMGPIRVGVDLAAVAAVSDSLARFGTRYTSRVFTAREMTDCRGTAPARARGLAARFAAKEAVLKALRASDVVPPWTDIEVIRTPGGWPEIQLHGVAAQLAAQQGLATWAVSLTHETNVAAAIVVASGPPQRSRERTEP